MFTITMSSKGQFVLPKEVREKLKLMPGVKVRGTIDERGRLVLTPLLLTPEDLFRSRPPVKKRATVEEMDEAIKKAIRDGRI